MRAASRGLAFAMALTAIHFSGVAEAQQAAPQYYGYPTAQKAMPSGQAHYGCQPGPACQPERYGCGVTLCPCPSSNACQVINSQIPPIHPLPGCYEPNTCTVVNEGPPTLPPQTITIYRNSYVPIRVVNQPTNVAPVNIQVNWREIHVLCGADGRPLSTEQAAAVVKELNTQFAGATPAAPSAPTPRPRRPSRRPPLPRPSRRRRRSAGSI